MQIHYTREPEAALSKWQRTEGPCKNILLVQLLQQMVTVFALSKTCTAFGR
jgi:hypothetical protein